MDSISDINYQIIGNDVQLVEIELGEGESVRAEPGSMIYMKDGIEMSTSTGKGLLDGLKRVFTSEDFFVTSFTHTGDGKSYVAFSAPFPGQIAPIDLSSYSGSFLCQKASYLCSSTDVDIDIAITKNIGAGLFGGEGFILQKLSGNGSAFTHAGGTLIGRTLEPDESVRVKTGSVVGFSSEVNYNIKLVGGIKNTLFGKEGLFITELTGPGDIYLQSLPLSRFTDWISNEQGRSSSSRSFEEEE